MAFTLNASSNYSFIQVNETDNMPECSAEISGCIPVFEQNDLQFQLIARITGDDRDWFEQPVDPSAPEGSYFTVWGKICTDCYTEPELNSLLFSYCAKWTKIGTDGGTDIWLGNFAWNGNTPVWNTINPGDCFNLCFHRGIAVPGNIHDFTPDFITYNFCTSGCFQRISDVCFTSKFIYACQDNAFDFYYVQQVTLIPGAWANVIRLPCYLRDCQLPSEEKTYQKSDGSYIKLFERIDEEYELNIDWIPKIGHKRIKVMLAHDIVLITNTNDSPVDNMPVVCRDKYEIQWPEKPWQHAPAKTKLRRSSPLHLLNSNCQ